ncbi:hypothetical protein C5167_034819 [Papaver somniferum]|uniref:protein-serine/threonine phosphatase n=1 Tax=Papaver somniferum TaxID=3469 RepID=A0A4Y7KI57_PAPSO|nr:hypothetical protein C5167_034819 [Papaver somniferum]
MTKVLLCSTLLLLVFWAILWIVDIRNSLEVFTIVLLLKARFTVFMTSAKGYMVLCVHGGLSPDVRTIDQMRVIERNCEIPHDGPFCDLMWSDPEEIETWAVSPRGAGWLFGSRPIWATDLNEKGMLSVIITLLSRRVLAFVSSD